MNVFITLLSYDHGILRQVLDVLEDISENDTWKYYEDIIPQAIEFLNKFMDQYHHGKEESFLFPAIPASESSLREQIDHLIEEHKQVKIYINEIESGSELWDLELLRDSVNQMTSHMRHHIIEEEDIVFPRIAEHLDRDADMALFEESQKYMEVRFGASFLAEMEQFANQFQNRVMGEGVIKYSSSGA
ncbi:MAG: hemerythrin domain-containing protein [Euryarchaeota archaeon]|nr:hemerythrin domain-containing protein [Euryarchaeota archaeon]